MKIQNDKMLRNPDVEPTSVVIAEALGEANVAYEKFIKELDCHNIQLEWRYYTDGKSWLAKGLYEWIGLRGGHNSKTIFWLSIWSGFFKVTIYIPEKTHADAMKLTMDGAVKKVVANSKKMGKLNYCPLAFDLYTDENFDSIFTLINFRKSV